MAFGNFINMEKQRRYKLLLTVTLLMVAAVILVLYMAKTPATPPPTAQVAQPRADAISGQAGGQGSEEYNKKLQENDDKKANEALKGGLSYVPTPIGNKKGVVGKKEPPKPTPPPVVAKVKTAPTQAPRADNTLHKRMIEDLAALDAKLSAVAAGSGKIIYEKDFSKDLPVASASETRPPKPETAVSTPDLKPGDVLYAIIDTGVNSDVPSAVMATVAQGKYRNSRLLGSFQRHEERMVLAFSRVILPDGKNLQLEAYAVDPQTSEASVASSVDTHFFSRWGGLIASSFLEGLGGAKRYSGASSTVYGYGNQSSDQMVWNNYSPEDQAWIAMGKVGEKAAKIFEKGFDRPPTVYLESGSPVGILIINVKGA